MFWNWTLCCGVCVYTVWRAENYSARRTVHTHHWFKSTLPNTDQAHDKHQWTTTNFSQVQLYTPWWWIAYDPKLAGVIFNFMSFKFLHNVDFNVYVLYNQVHLVG